MDFKNKGKISNRTIVLEHFFVKSLLFKRKRIHVTGIFTDVGTVNFDIQVLMMVVIVGDSWNEVINTEFQNRCWSEV